MLHLQGNLARYNRQLSTAMTTQELPQLLKQGRKISFSDFVDLFCMVSLSYLKIFWMMVPSGQSPAIHLVIQEWSMASISWTASPIHRPAKWTVGEVLAGGLKHVLCCLYACLYPACILVLYIPVSHCWDGTLTPSQLMAGLWRGYLNSHGTVSHLLMERSWHRDLDL